MKNMKKIQTLCIMAILMYSESGFECTLNQDPVLIRIRNTADVVLFHQSLSLQYFLVVADPGCLSRILTFSHLRLNNKKRRGKIVVLRYLYKAIFFTIENYFVFEQIQRKFKPIGKEMKYFLPNTLYLSSQRNLSSGSEIRYPRSRIRKIHPGSGFRGHKSTGSWIWIRNTVFL
jgi:hypothetical protein